jgi:hypothetical protein
MGDTTTDPHPSHYQGKQLLAALADDRHRIPADTRRVTLKAMASRQWIRRHNAGATVDTRTDTSSGAYEYRLTQRGVRVAQRQRCQVLLRPHGPHLPLFALYAPLHSEDGYMDEVSYIGRPDIDGCVTVFSGRRERVLRGIPLGALRDHPGHAYRGPGPLTDQWAVTDRTGRAVTQVQAADYASARDAADAAPDTSVLGRRLGGLMFRRLRAIELPTRSA